ncbi:FkbM family methyltransferase [Sphingomonas sp.]|uniref:FkbM family methyltransferase n=1 Tax=Sphingomonas sp. TaxID=28214 RepID=UPI0025E02AF8|nr:FkbM family methyltransferase [Sphingomonas sp.]
MPSELHPSAAARAMRAMRGLTNLRGWHRVAAAAAGSSGAFRVANDGLWLEGDLGSLIEREFYLYGGYEREQIDLFLSLVPRERRGTILDIGANIGTHSLRFSQAFEHVLSFEPNPLVIDRLRRNVALNDARNIAVHHVGLGDAPADLELFAPVGTNQGLGTFLTTDQYDLPLERIGMSRIEAGDAYVGAHAPGRIDAIKCDVQGFEVQVFAGLQDIIRRDRPIVWVEVGGGAHTVADEIAALIALLPAPARYFRMSTESTGLVSHATLVEADAADIVGGDWVIVPR